MWRAIRLVVDTAGHYQHCAYFHRGLVVNEAFNQGVPVIATDAVGAVAGGLVRDGLNGLVVREVNSAAITAQLERVVNDPGARQRMGAAPKQVIAEWNQDAQAAGFARALEFALGAKVEP